jgi:hypothetical protein
MILLILTLLALVVAIVGPSRVEEFVLDAFVQAGMIPVSIQMAGQNLIPEHWENSSVKSFDQAYRNMKELVTYENAAFHEAGWQPIDGASPSGNNILGLTVSLAFITFVCMSFFVLVVLS